MNNPSPLVPQGTQPPRGKSSLYFKILMILSVHVVLIGGMLLQGCKDTSKEQTKDPALSQAGGDTSPISNSVASTDPAVQPLNTIAMSNQAVATLPPAQPYTTPTMPSSALPATIPSPATPVQATVLSTDGGGKDYLIAKGDTFGAIAKRNSISVKALMDANPGVNARKLRVGQKLQIPASTGIMAANSSSAAATGPAETAPSGARYTVKSGDTLAKIARTHGTSYKKIMALNDLKTTAIHVGQKLKLPAAKSVSADLSGSSAPIVATPTPAPGPVSSVSTPVTGVAN